jgi:2-polyprenyl-3-methyl-5-hydroxy-6-metoxy-1,4-benzoquinol methylase
MIKIKMSEEEIKKEIENLSPWYSNIELLPGIFTPGHMLGNIALTRELIRRCDVKGCLCLDIGAMEALITILLKRQGAADVVAVDGDNRSHKMPLLKATYGVDFQYFGNISLHNMVDFLLSKSRLYDVGNRSYQFGFDLVVLSGILYHVYSPVHVLAAARSCLREEGLMVIETAAINDPGYIMQYNYTGAGYIYGWTDTWFMSAPLLDYFCRFFQLEPLDCLYVTTPSKKCTGLIRLGVVCKAVNSILDTHDDDIMRQSSRNYDYNTIVRYDLVTGKNKPPVAFEVNKNDLVLRNDIKTCDLHATINKRKPLEFTEDRLLLKLSDIF